MPDSLHNPRNRSVAPPSYQHVNHWPLWRLIGVALLVATLMVSVFSGEVVRHYEKSYLEEQLLSQTRRVLSTLAAASIDAVIVRDHTKLEALAEETVKHDPAIVELRFQDARKRTLYQWHRKKASTETRKFDQELKVEGDNFGEISAQWDISNSIALIDSHVSKIRILVMVSLLILSAMLQICLHLFVLSPVNQLSNQLSLNSDGPKPKGTFTLASKEVVQLQTALRERLQTEEALRFTRFYLDHAGDPSFWITEDGQFFYTNEAALKLVGATAIDITKASVGQVFPAFTLETWREFWKGLDSTKQFTLDCRCRRLDGTEFPANTTINFLQYQGHAYCCAFVRDITDRRRAEEALQRAHDELEERVRERTKELQLEVSERKSAEATAKKAQEMAEIANKAKSEFLATMSHEIRTPMNAVLGFTNLLQGTPLNEEQADFVNTIKSSGESLLALINDILDFSRIEAGHVQLEHIAFDLPQISEDVAILMASAAEEKGLELVFQCDPDVPRHWIGDPIRVRQLLLNLIGNAIKFTERGHVAIYIQRHRPALDPGTENVDTAEERIRITVEDTGIGIIPEKQHLLFEKFSQMDGSHSRKFGGAGLGLAMCRLLIDEMRGTIGVDSEPQKGSRFWFTLPIQLDETEISLPEPTHEVRASKVLIAETHLLSRNTLSRQLQHWGIKHECTTQASEILAKLRITAAFTEPFEILILDANIADKDAIALAQEIRKDRILNTTGLILLANPSQRTDTSIFLNRGFAATLLRPVARPAATVEALKRARDQHVRLKHETDQVRLAEQEKARENQSSQSSSNTSLFASPFRDSTHILRGMRVLLVEDNDINQRLARRLLEDMGGQITVAPNGKEAVDRVMVDDYDLIMMDCQMPIVDGFEATKTIRRLESQSLLANPNRTHIPIIALTANVIAGDRERCIAAGMDDYVPKPIKKDDLRAAIARTLSKWNNQSAGSAPTPPPTPPSPPHVIPPSPPPTPPEKDTTRRSEGNLNATDLPTPPGEDDQPPGPRGRPRSF